MTQWGSPYKMSCHLYLVDPDTWETGTRVANVKAFSMSRSGTDQVPLLESCTFEMSNAETAREGSRWYRMVAHVTQKNSVERVPIMTFLRSDESKDLKTTTVTKGSGYSTLKPADLVKITTGDYAPKGVDGPSFAKKLLTDGGVLAPIEVVGSFQLSDYVVFDPGMTYLEAVWDVLDSGGWVMFIDPNGVITIKEKPKEHDLLLDRTNAKLIRNDVKESFDEISVCNRYIVPNGSGTVICVNDLEDSRMSVQNRGFTVDYVDTSPTPIDGESLDHYAMRMLKERSIVQHKYSYTRRFYPGILPFSLVKATVGSLGFMGDLRVLTQSVSFGSGGVKVSETAAYEEVTYDPWQLK